MQDILGKKLIGYGIFRLDKTGYIDGKSLSFAILQLKNKEYLSFKT